MKKNEGATYVVSECGVELWDRATFAPFKVHLTSSARAHPGVELGSGQAG